MIHRTIHIAKFAESAAETAKEIIRRASPPDSVSVATVHAFRDTMFLYSEREGDDPEPDGWLSELSPLLERISLDGKSDRFARMIDIFHYHVPVEGEPWRCGDVGAPWIRIARIYPDKMASYAFYHWQLQEERPGDGPKHGLIAAYGNMLYFYMERPFVKEPTSYAGILNTRNTPDRWHDLMNPHFIPWEDAPAGQSLFREDLELILNHRRLLG